MKKVVTPVVRKIYGGSQQVQIQGQPTQIQQQQNAVRKINNLLQSGTVSVTSSAAASPHTTTKVIQRQFLPTRTSSGLQINQTQTIHRKCFICDEAVQPSTSHCVADTFTASTHTKLTTKIARLVGEGYMVIIGPEDILCRRCYTLFNMMDKAEADMEKYKTQINSFLKKKYSVLDTPEVIDLDAVSNTTTTTTTFNSPNNGNINRLTSPPVKMQRLNNSSGDGGTTIINRVVTSQHTNLSDNNVQLRKITVNSSGNTINTSNNDQNDTTTSPLNKSKVGPTKLYKCMSCEYKSTDLSTFDSHYQECKGQNNSNKNASSTTNNTIVTKKIPASQLHQCSMCNFKSTDKAYYEEHVKKHLKMRPFKCRICTRRFETREQAQVHAKTHQPDYFKCGMCSATFNRRDLLMKHLETHDKAKQQIQMVSSVHAVTAPSNTTQKLLQETIDEALRDTTAGDISAKSIQFHSCDKCSVTFVNEALYLQHVKQHKTTSASNAGGGGVQTKQSSRQNSNGMNEESSGVAVKQEQSNTMNDDLESIFERMHADKAEISANAANNADNLVITQDNTSTGAITFNITIPQQAGGDENSAANQQQVSIDMPTLDGEPETKTESVKAEAQEGQQQQIFQAPVSMPSLDDDQDGNTQESHVSNTDAVPMELDEIQAGADGQQIKFILNENGQILSLDNHILTTDMDGNQILVQGTDMEQLQAILQSGGVVMQGEDGIGEGQTLQMISTGDGQNQMVLIQGADGQEAQLIDASMLDADGNIVIQQHPTGELNAEGTHITTEDGIQIPVSITFGSGEDGEGHITVQEGSEEQMQLLQAQQAEADQAEHQEGGQTLMLLQQGGADEGQVKAEQEQAQQEDENTQETEQQEQQAGEGATVVTSEASATGNSEGFLNFDELIQPQIINKEATTATTTASN